MVGRLKRLMVSITCLGVSVLALALAPGGAWAEGGFCHLGCTTDCEGVTNGQYHCEMTCGEDTTMECGETVCGVEGVWYIVCALPS